MTAKRSQMWPGWRWGWQRLGTAGRGGRVAGPGTRGPWGGQRASRTRSERAAAGRAGPAGEVTRLWAPGEDLRLNASESLVGKRGYRVGSGWEKKVWQEREERGDPRG